MNNMIKNENYGILDPLFDELFFGNKNKHEVMKTDIKDEGDYYLMKIDLPEVKKENIKLSLEDGYLIVSAKFDYNNEDKEKNNYIRRERHYGNCSRSYYLGEDVTEEDIKAKLQDGVLTLNVKKVVEKQISTVTVENVKGSLLYTKSNSYTPRNFRVYPYSQLNSTILPNYKSYYEKYKAVVTSRYPNLQFDEVSG